MAEISVAAQMDKITRELEKDVKDVTKKAIMKVARQTAQQLKSTSPRKTGEYASGWATKQIDGNGSRAVYNKNSPSLTHLLENGHVIRNKKGTYGRVNGKPHIKPAEEWASNELPNEIMRTLK